MQELITAKDNIKVVLGVTVDALLGDVQLSGVTVRSQKDGATADYLLDGLFVAIGLVPKNEAFANVISLDSRGYAEADESCTTKTNGIFVAGDCRTKQVRQVTTATGDGAVAALAACRYVDNLKL